MKTVKIYFAMACMIAAVVIISFSMDLVAIEAAIDATKETWDRMRKS